jgi:hypothetical protein
MRGLLLGVVLVFATVHMVDARPLFTCRDGRPASSRIMHMRGRGGRTYPFCITDSAQDGVCEFAFCPDLAQVVSCALVRGCLQLVALCSDPAWVGRGDRFPVERGKSILVQPAGAAISFRLIGVGSRVVHQG